MRNKASFVAVLLVLAFFTTALAERVDWGKGSDVSVIVEESDVWHTIVRFEVGAFDKNPVKTDRGTYYKISCSREALLTNKGEPELPQLLRNIIIPDDRDMEIKVLSSEYRDFEGLPVAPSKGLLPRSADPDTIPYTFGPVYDSDAWYPSRLAEITGPFIMRDFRGTAIELNAFQYHPKTQVLRVYTSVTVEVRIVGPSRVNVLERRKEPRKRVRAFEEIYRNQFINYSFSQTKVDYLGESGDMLIITSDGFHDYMMPFVEWKRQKGIKTTIVDVSTIGNDTTSIKAFIQGYYNDDTTNLAWLLVVGDVDSVPTPYAPDGYQGAYSGPADPVYSLIVGDDGYPEIFVGRFSAEDTSHVQTQVNRSIEYEKDLAGGSWLHKGTCVASLTEGDIRKARQIAELLRGFTYTHVDLMFEPDASGAGLAFVLKQGRSIVSFAGHGAAYRWTLDPPGQTFEFTSDDVDELENYNELPFIYSTACNVGAMDFSYPCFAEHWLRATKSGFPTGAITVYMSSRVSVYANNEGMADLLVNEGMSAIGALCFNSLLGHSNFKTQNIFGDPSLQLRTDAPQQLVVDHSGELDVGQTEYEVEVDGVEGALCALYNDGVLYGSAYSNFFGVATIPIEVLLPEDDSLTLTVTAFNKATYTDQVAIPNFPPHNFHVESWTDNSVTLAWMPKAAWTSKGYNIYRDTLSGQPGVKINPRLIPWLRSSYSNIGLDFGRTYYYTITNVDTNFQESERSPEVRITLGQPSAPTGLTADTVGCDIRLDWLPNPEEDSVTQYRVYRKAPEDDAFILSDSTTDTTYIDTNITRVGLHKHAVTAVNNLGFESHLSAPTSVEFTVEVEAPDSLWVLSWFDRTVTLDWTGSESAAGYNVYRTTSGVFNDPPINGTPITESIYQDTGLTEGTVYYYVASTIADSANCGVETEMSTNPLGFLAGRPQTPAGLQADVNAGCEITLSWWSNPDGDILKYRIYHRADTSGSSLQARDSVCAPDTTYADTSISDGLNHYYAIVAIDSFGLESDMSAQACTTLAVGIPDSILVVGYDGASVSLRGKTELFEDLIGCNFYRSLDSCDYAGLEPINDTLSIPDANGHVYYTDFEVAHGTTYYYTFTNVSQCSVETERCPWIPAGDSDIKGARWLQASIYTYVAGDANNDGVVAVGDIVFLTNYVYQGGPAPPVMEAADASGDCEVDAGDITYLVNYLYQSGPPPVYECSGSKSAATVPLSKVRFPRSRD